ILSETNTNCCLWPPEATCRRPHQPIARHRLLAHRAVSTAESLTSLRDHRADVSHAAEDRAVRTSNAVGMGAVGKRGGDGGMMFHRRHGDGEHEGGKNGPSLQ